MFKIEWNRKYTTIAVYSCIVIAIAVIILVVGLNANTVWNSVKRFAAVLDPIWLGIIFAYLCNPLFRLFELKVFAFVSKKRPHRRLRRTLAICATYLVVLLLITTFLLLVVPQIMTSYNDLIARFSSYINSAISFADHFVREFPLFNGEYETFTDLIDINALTAKIREWITNSGNLIRELTNYAISYGSTLVSGAKNLLLAIILSVYLLASKEKLTAQCKKIIAAFLPRARYERVCTLAAFSDRTFGGFIVGKLLDSLIIGILSFIVFAIFEMPYYPLIAVIVGVTNVIPFFGPFIGAIPSAFIIFIAEPRKILLFVLLILIIQQLDGNVIGPKILGDSTGLSSLGVMVSIIVMGGYFGFIGMFFGVPIFAIAYAMLKEFIEGRLASREMPIETTAYYRDPATVPPKKEERPSLTDRAADKIKLGCKSIAARLRGRKK